MKFLYIYTISFLHDVICGTIAALSPTHMLSAFRIHPLCRRFSAYARKPSTWIIPNPPAECSDF